MKSSKITFSLSGSISCEFIISSVLLLFLVGGAPSYASLVLTFNPIINLSNNSGASTAPVIAVVGSHVYVAWEDKSINGKQAQTFFRSSNSSGATFGPTLEFTGLPGAANNQLDAVQIAAEGQYVFLTWQQGGATAFANSSNFGASLSWRIISSGAPPGFMTGQTIAVNETNVYVSWSESETPTGNQEESFSLQVMMAGKRSQFPM